MTRRTSVILAGALGSVLIMSSVAFAIPTVVTPTLSMTATTADSKIRAAGSFNPVNTTVCGSKKNRIVTLQGDATATGTTNNSGAYNILTGKLAAGVYTVNTFVPGSITGPYGSELICNDAVSPSATVNI